MRKIPETITEDELAKILQATRKRSHAIAYMLGFYECMRVSEVVKLQPEHVDYGQRIIRIKQAKGNKDRNIPIHPVLMKKLKFLPLGSGIRAYQIAFKRIGKKVLGKDLHFHTLRHSGATYYLNKHHWSTRQVQVLLGHSKITTTEIYTHVNPQDLIKLMWNEE